MDARRSTVSSASVRTSQRTKSVSVIKTNHRDEKRRGDFVQRAWFFLSHIYQERYVLIKSIKIQNMKFERGEGGRRNARWNSLWYIRDGQTRRRRQSVPARGSAYNTCYRFDFHPLVQAQLPVWRQIHEISDKRTVSINTINTETFRYSETGGWSIHHAASITTNITLLHFPLGLPNDRFLICPRRGR